MYFLNSLVSGKFQWIFKWVIFKPILVIDGWGISYEIALRWLSLDPTDDKSTLIHVMAWCCQEASHYLSQCWPRSMAPNWIWSKFICIPFLLYPKTLDQHASSVTGRWIFFAFFHQRNDGLFDCQQRKENVCAASACLYGVVEIQILHGWFLVLNFQPCSLNGDSQWLWELVGMFVLDSYLCSMV